MAGEKVTRIDQQEQSERIRVQDELSLISDKMFLLAMTERFFASESSPKAASGLGLILRDIANEVAVLAGDVDEQNGKGA